MADLTQNSPNLPSLWKRIDKAWLAILLIPALLAIFDPAQVWPTITFAGNAMPTRVCSLFLRCWRSGI